MARSKDRVRQQRLSENTGLLVNFWIRVLLRMAGRINAGQLSLVLPDGSKVSNGFQVSGPRRTRNLAC